MVFPKEFFQKVYFEEKNQQKLTTTKNMKNYQICNELWPIHLNCDNSKSLVVRKSRTFIKVNKKNNAFSKISYQTQVYICILLCLRLMNDITLREKMTFLVKFYVMLLYT